MQQKELLILCSSKIGSKAGDSERGDQWKWEKMRSNSFYNSWQLTVLYMKNRVKAGDMLNIANCRREEKNLKPLRSLSTVLSRGNSPEARTLKEGFHTMIGSKV